MNKKKATRLSGGFSVVELVIAVGVILIVIAVAVPTINSSLRYFRARNTVAIVTNAIQSSRFQAIASGFPYQVVFSSANSTYQVQVNSDPQGAGAWSNVGSLIQISRPGTPVTISADTTLLFRPSGAVSATTGALAFTLTSDHLTENIQVTNYGKVTVTP